jgi:hypothetical protein
MSTRLAPSTLRGYVQSFRLLLTLIPTVTMEQVTPHLIDGVLPKT